METWLTHPYAHFAFYVYGICVNVQGIYTMYNVNVLTIQWCIKLPSLNEGIQLIFKNSLDHFPLPRMGDIPHTHCLMTHSSYAFYWPRIWSFDQLPSLKWRNSTDFQKLAWPFPFAKDEGHSTNTLLDDTLIPCIFFSTLYMFIQLPTPLMMNRNINWVQLFPFSLSHDNENMVSSPICTHCTLGL